MTWKETAQKKRLALQNAIPPSWIKETIKDDMIKAGYTNTYEYLDSILPKEEVSIIELTVLELKDKIAAGELSSLRVVEAYCHRAALAQQILNCCSEIFFDKALEKAKELDGYYKKTGKTIGPLHGIPISLKDQVDLPGFDSSIGYVGLLNQPKTEISLLADLLQKSGAVFYVKTTVPMAMMAPETISNAYGYTWNACNIKLSCGGSSGGEGALIGAGASPLGFGTDIGGSIRIPATFQGLSALKPSTGRISYLNVTNSYCNQETLPSVIGPLARSLGDVQYITKLIIDTALWETDPKVLPVPYADHEQLKLSKLTFGVWRFDGKVTPHPPIVRALEKTIKALKEQGHEVIEFPFPIHDKVIKTANYIFTADQGFEVEEVCKISGEPVVPSVYSLITRSEPGSKALSLNEWWDKCGDQYELKQKFLSLWNETAKTSKSGKPIDAIIAPTWPSCSFVPGFPAILNYSCPFNLLDCASVIVPVTKVEKAIDLVDTKYEALNDLDKQNYDLYDPELFDGMPVCLQVIGKKLEDEKTLVVASVVEHSLKESN